MTSASGKCTIIYNGEVYNTRTLRNALEERGVSCRTTSDTEVILEGYEIWGPEIVTKLHGMFAFLIWDRSTQSALLARDRVGIKPLYIAQSASSLACASDARALRALGYGGGVDQDAMAQYLMLGYVAAPRSIWNGIEKLEAGTMLTWSSDGTIAKRTYWSAPDDTDYQQGRAGISDLIDEVVEEHLLSDVPVGLFLSGGIDSSVIASSVASLGTAQAQNMTALTVAFPGQVASDEAPVAERTAKQLNLDVKVLPLTQTSDHSYARSVSTLDEPLAYNAVVSQSAISELAAQSGLTVVLSGDGGDEVFGGYRWHEQAPASEFCAPSARRGLKGWTRRFRTAHRRADREVLAGDRLRRHSDLTLHAFRVFPALRPDHVASLMGVTHEEHYLELLHSTFAQYDAKRLPWKRRMQRIDLYTFCQDVVLPKVDRAGMAYSIEARPPLLDHRIIEWGISHPQTDTFDAAPKQTLRQIVRDRGLGFLLDEPKRGFSLKLKSMPDPMDMAQQIDKSVSGLGLSADWRQILHDQTEILSIKTDVMYFLALWHQTQVPSDISAN